MKMLLDSFDTEIYFSDVEDAKEYYDYYIDNNYDEPHQDERVEFNNNLYACESLDEISDVLNDWYSKNDMLGHHFYVKDF